LPPPELWHFDDIIWLRRSTFGRVARTVGRGADPHRHVLDGADDITEDDVARFWDDFVPAIAREATGDFHGVRTIVTSVRERFGRPLLYKFERIAARYGAFAVARLEPHFNDRGIWAVFGGPRPSLDAKNYYHLGMFGRFLVAAGRDIYDRAMGDVAVAAAELAKMTLHTGAYLDVIFRYEIYVFQASKFRLLAAYLEHEGRPKLEQTENPVLIWLERSARRLFGAIDMVELLKTEFQTEEHELDIPERWPRFAIQDDGAIRLLEA
jgi:hypothetical protein